MSVDRCVTRVPVFRSLTPSQQADVMSFARPVAATAGEQVMAVDSITRRLLVVHSGELRLVHLLDNGREHLVRMLTPGDAIGEDAFLLGRRPQHFAIAETDVQLCTFDHEDLARLVARYPEIAVRMLQVQAERLAAAERMLAAFSNNDVGARVAAYLLEFPTITGNRIELPMAKKDVASYLGTTPETFSRRLREFVEAGMIELDGRRGIVIHDPDALIRRTER